MTEDLSKDFTETSHFTALNDAHNNKSKAILDKLKSQQKDEQDVLEATVQHEECYEIEQAKAFLQKFEFKNNGDEQSLADIIGLLKEVISNKSPKQV